MSASMKYGGEKGGKGKEKRKKQKSSKLGGEYFTRNVLCMYTTENISDILNIITYVDTCKKVSNSYIDI